VKQLWELGTEGNLVCTIHPPPHFCHYGWTEKVMFGAISARLLGGSGPDLKLLAPAVKLGIFTFQLHPD